MSLSRIKRANQCTWTCMMQNCKGGASSRVGHEEYSGIRANKHGGPCQQCSRLFQGCFAAEVDDSRADGFNLTSYLFIVPPTGQDNVHPIALPQPCDVPNVGINGPVSPCPTPSSTCLKDHERTIYPFRKAIFESVEFRFICPGDHLQCVPRSTRCLCNGCTKPEDMPLLRYGYSVAE